MKIVKSIGAIAAYWVLLFIGPAIVMIFNDIGYYVTGGGWGPDSLMHAVLQFFSQPISCAIAYGAMKYILKDDGKVLSLVNCVIASCMCAVFAFTATETSQRWAMIVSIVVCAYTAVIASKEINR